MSYHPEYHLIDKIRTALQSIEELRSQVLTRRILPEVEASVRYRASIESIHSSTSIEGNPLNSREIRAIISSDRPLSKEEYATIEVKNYKNALEYIEQRRLDGNALTIEDILELHRIITDRLLDCSRNGKIRANPVYIVNERSEILYTAVAPERVQRELEDLVRWISSQQFSVHPIVLAGIVHYQIAAIHPFSDGNGRTARAASALFLALSQYDNNGALTLDPYFASDRPAYYKILRLVSGSNYDHSSHSDLTPWLEYFVDGYLTSLHILDAEIRLLDLALPEGPRDTLNQEEQDILSFVSKFGSISISEAEGIIPELDRRTVQRRLKDLVDKGYLKLVGSTHEAKYILPSPNNPTNSEE